LTVVVRRTVGEKGALRGRGLGPWMLAVIFREEVGGRKGEDVGEGAEGISK
jgi:hypothetical protein